MIALNIGATGAIERLRALVDKTRAGVRDAVAASAERLVALVQAKLSGEVLNARSGALRASIRAETDETSARISSDVPYARIQEYGGHIALPEIVPVNARALAFAYGGKLVFAKRVKAHGVDIPERSYMQSSLAEFEAGFVDDIRRVAAEALQ